MARYKLHEKAYFDNTVYEEGAIITVSDDVFPAAYMQPMDKVAKEKYLAAKEQNFKSPRKDVAAYSFANFNTFDEELIEEEMQEQEAIRRPKKVKEFTHA
jgi:hypothetical protein